MIEIPHSENMTKTESKEHTFEIKLIPQGYTLLWMDSSALVHLLLFWFSTDTDVRYHLHLTIRMDLSRPDCAL